MRGMNVDQIATDALEIEDQAQRQAFLERACGGDAAVRQQVDALLKALQQADQDSFLSSGLFGPPSEPKQDPASVDERSREDRFRLRNRHAIGGLGEVWIAWDRQLHREVALKRIRPEWADHPEATARFRREAEITGFLEHPGIVPIYSLGDDDSGCPFYAMQFIRGRTLQQIVAEHIDVPESASPVSSPTRAKRVWYDQQTLRQLLNHFVDVCQTIDYAHSREVVHRDLKPSNIMLGAYGQTLVVDWGLAKRFDATEFGDEDKDPGTLRAPDPLDEFQTLSSPNDSSVDETRQGTTMGTPRYMSPEQAAGKTGRIGPAADIYCLGATLYFILTGQAPHVGEADLESTFSRIVRGEFDPPQKVRAEVPKPLQAIVMKAMANHPDERYQSAGDFAEDVGRYLGDQPISIFRDPLSERVLRWMRNHRAATSALAVGVMLLVIGTISGVLVWEEMKRRDLEAQRLESDALAKIRLQEETQRLEAIATAEAALGRADSAVRDSRFADAAALIRVAIDRMENRPTLADRREQLIEKHDRLERLGTFDAMRRRGEYLDHLARDTEAAILLQGSLDQLGVWDSNTWWADLPDDDLSALQQDRLRWQIYHIMTALNSTYISRMVSVMGGSKDGGTPRTFEMLKSWMSGSAGMSQAMASVELTRRIESFRPSQAARWLGNLADFRIAGGKRIAPEDLGPPENPPDGWSLSIFSLIASVDPGYRVWFNDYGKTFLEPSDEDPALRCIRVALESLRRVSDDAVDDYWIRQSVAQAYFLLAQYAEQQGDFERAIERYELARSEYGRCIAIHSDIAFAYGDRSTVALRQALLMQTDKRSGEQQRLRAEQLLRESSRDANEARRLEPHSDWVYWHLGATAVGNRRYESAIEAFFTALDRGFDVEANLDAPLFRLDDLRGRKDAVEFARRQTAAIDSTPKPNPQIARSAALMAALEYSRGNRKNADDWASKALQFNPDEPHAHQIAGWSDLLAGNYTEADAHFAAVLRVSPDDTASLFGAAKVAEQKPNPDIQTSETYYRRAIETAQSVRHRSAAWFGIAKQALRRGELEQARSAIDSARELDPACDINQFHALARGQAKQILTRHRRESDDAIKQTLMNQIKELKVFVDSIAELPNASVNQIVEAASEDPPHALPLLGADFELPLDRYWQVQPIGDRNKMPSQLSSGSPPVRIETGHAVDGNSALVVRRHEPDRPTEPWKLFQTIPATGGHTYRIAASVSSPSKPAVAANPARVRMMVQHNGHTLLSLPLIPTGTTWNEREAEFTLPPSDPVIAPLTIGLEIEDPQDQTLYVDRIEITVAQ